MKIATRQFFEAAHRLSDYEEDCKRVHGHNWVVDIEIESNRELNKTGFVVDFKEIKRLMKMFDHRLIVKDTNENHKYFDNLPEDWVVFLPVNPTCENLAQYIKDNLFSSFDFLEGEDRIVVKVFECFKPEKTSYAEI